LLLFATSHILCLPKQGKKPSFDKLGMTFAGKTRHSLFSVNFFSNAFSKGNTLPMIIRVLGGKIILRKD